MLFFKGQERFPTRRPLQAELEPRAVGTHARLKQFCKMVLVVVLTVALVIGLPGAVFQGELFDSSGFAALGASCVLALLFYLWHHADRKREVWIHLGEHRGSVVLSVRDDGIGFDLAARTMGSYGLMGIRYRVDAQGGELQVQSSLGHGTLVRAVLPISGGMHKHCVDA